jgi:hypothetical protein
MKSDHHYVTQLQRSLRPNALAEQVADSLHLLQLIHSTKILGQQLHPRQAAEVGEHPQQPTSHRSKPTYPSIPSS